MMKTWWALTWTAILSVIVVWQQLGFTECSRPELWIPARILTEKEAFHEICPMDFTKLSSYPWVTETCNNWSPEENLNSTACCNALLSGMGMAEAQLLNETGIFRLPEVSMVGSCLQQLQTQLESQGLKHKAVETCFPDTLWPRFVTNNSLCLEIETSDDFEELVGPDNIRSLQRACAGDLTDPPACSKCNNEMLEVYTVLNKLPRNLTHLSIAYKNLTENITLGKELDGRFLSDCFFDMILYTAAKATTSGAWSESTAVCTMAVMLTEKDRPFLTITEMVLIGLASSVCSTLLGCVIFCIWRSRKKRAEAHKEIIDRDQKMLKSVERPNIGLIKYNYRDIRAATDNFSPENLIGQGGFGTVYKGLMKDGLEVAVKRIHNVTQDGDADFLNEVEIISRIRHRNLVILRGCCVTSNGEDGHQRLLVYDHMPNGSLDKMLYGQSEGVFLTWANRVKIIAGVAKGLAYLHNDTQPSIIHTDIKPANILLDEDLNARVADFGLARLSDGPEYPVTGRRGRTPGYVAPEYALYGQLTEKSDVYSFGVVMLELLTGRKALDPSQESTPNYPVSEWAASMVQAGKVWEVVDERIRYVGPKEKMQTYVMIGCMCTQKMVTLRPTFREVLKYLQGELPLPSMSLPMQNFPFSSYDWPDVDSLAHSRRHPSPDAADLYVLTELLR